MSTRVVVVPTDPDWRPTQGTFFDAIVAALELAAVPAQVVEHEQDGALRRLRTARRELHR